MMQISTPIPTRPLGNTGRHVTIFGLGGEGVLRTNGQLNDAMPVIHRALDEGVTYCDTAPAYAQSMQYYGASLGERRGQIFLASKTHDRTRDGSLRLLDASLKTLRTDHLDLWQLHDLRTMSDLNQIFAKGGALEALLKAKEEGRVRHLGITGHYDPAILMEAMRRFDFDTVLVALNPSDVHRMSFLQTVVPEAARRGMGVIAMKSTAQGALLGPGKLNMSEAMSYVLSIPGVSLVIIGCKTPEEVSENANLARAFSPLSPAQMQDLETRTARNANHFSYYKRMV